MPKPVQPRDFFVVGGPVQSDRACYVKRAADRQLMDALSEGQFAYVLGPKASGKTSLMARAIRRLRSEGQLAAVVDLTQIGARSEGVDAGRWYYSIAYRIVRELRLKVDLQAWWHDKSALLSEQRLVEFFGDIVLANTSGQVNIFIDDAERAIELSYAAELFIAIRSCYMRRISEPDYARLNFVVIGVATPEQLCPDSSVSPFTDGVAIALEDFTLEESMQLAQGFDCEEQEALAIVGNIHRWTAGHPYLTQKVARSIARRSGTSADVDTAVHELLLAPARIGEEPLLNHMRGELEANDKTARQALGLLARVAAGKVGPRDDSSAARSLLDRIGVLDQSSARAPAYRNAVFEQVFDAGFSKAKVPFDWRRPAMIAAGVILILGLPYWYAVVLPRADIATLTVVTQDLTVALDAHARLRRLPGFGGTADRLLGDALVRRSEQTERIEEVLAADRVLRSLPDSEPLADQALADFWLRRAAAAMHAGDRDAALMLALAAREGRPEQAAGLALELIDSDYPYLEASFRERSPVVDWEIDWERDQIVSVDDSRRVRHRALGAASAPQPRGPQNPLPERLTAVQRVAVSRELLVDAEGTAGPFTLMLTVHHDRASDLVLRLTAPSGAAAELPVPQPRADQQDLLFTARGRSPLAALAAEPVRGLWSLSVVDRRPEQQGSLASWGLQFAGAARSWQDAPEQGIELPDPVRTEQVETQFAPGGRAALAVPTRPGAAGAVSIWDVAAGRLRADVELPAIPDFVRLLADGARLVTVSGTEASIRDVDSGDTLAAVTAAGRFATPPAVSLDQRIVAFAAAGRDNATAVTLIETGSGTRLSEFVVDSAVIDWGLSATGDYLALLDGSRRIRLYETAGGAEVGAVTHERRLNRLGPLTHADLLVAVDVDQAVVGWPLAAAVAGTDVGAGVFLGTTSAPDSVAVAAGARRVVFAGGDDRVEVRDLADGDVTARVLHVAEPRRLRLADSGDQLVVEGRAALRRFSLDAGAMMPAATLALSAAALEPRGSLAAFGYRAGHLRVRAASEAAGAVTEGGVDYIGHREAVTSVALNAAIGIAASGGADGVVRIWDLATVAPNAYFLRHPEGPVRTVEISPDGRWLASGAEYSARIWRVQSGELAAEIPVDGSALAVAFSASGDLIAVGDSAGNLFLGAPAGNATLRSARTDAAVSALAFSADSTLLASGDRSGRLVLWDVTASEQILASHAFAEPVSWIAFDGTDGGLLAASGRWLHSLVRAPTGLVVTGSRVVSARLGAGAGMTRVALGTVRVLETAPSGLPSVRELAIEDHMVSSATDPLLERDWSGILGLALDIEIGSVSTVTD